MGRLAMCSGSATRLASSALCLLLLGWLHAAAQEKNPGVRLLVQSSPLAGFRYHAAAEVWEELRVGERLELAREPGNAHDANPVSVSCPRRNPAYLPRRHNPPLP